jgi:hypothetical protein
MEYYEAAINNDIDLYLSVWKDYLQEITKGKKASSKTAV